MLRCRRRATWGRASSGSRSPDGGWIDIDPSRPLSGLFPKAAPRCGLALPEVVQQRSGRLLVVGVQELLVGAVLAASAGAPDRRLGLLAKAVEEPQHEAPSDLPRKVTAVRNRFAVRPVFEICVEENSHLPFGGPSRKFKR